MHTFNIWLMYFLMTYICFFSMHETSHLTLADGLFVLVLGGIGMVIPTPGGVGSYHAIVMIGLSVLGVGTIYLGEGGDPSNPALLFPTIVHVAQTLVAIIMGSAGLLILFLSKKKKMSHLKKIENKIFTINDLKVKTERWKSLGNQIVFTNGCFDIIHQGHIEVLSKSADLGEKLIVGLNSDKSIKKLKGKNRPIKDEYSRAMLLASFNFVDAVILFSEDTPIKLIRGLKPDILAKGGDYKIEEIAGHKIIKETGGEVKLIPFVEGYSSTQIIKKIKQK